MSIVNEKGYRARNVRAGVRTQMIWPQKLCFRTLDRVPGFLIYQVVYFVAARWCFVFLCLNSLEILQSINCFAISLCFCLCGYKLGALGFEIELLEAAGGHPILPWEGGGKRLNLPLSALIIGSGLCHSLLEVSKGKYQRTGSPLGGR